MNSHAALVRNDLGGLEPRRFATAADAATVALDRELPKPVRLIDHKQFAKRIQAPSRMVRAAFKRGALPGAIAHSDRLILVPAKLVNAVLLYGLCGLERRVKNGGLIP